MSQLGTAAGSDQTDLWLACKYHDMHPDCEDDLVLAAMQRSREDYLVTSDQKLLACSIAHAVAPGDLLVLLRALA